eukprot:3936845-Amphidinium_carterae.1
MMRISGKEAVDPSVSLAGKVQRTKAAMSGVKYTLKESARDAYIRGRRSSRVLFAPSGLPLEVCAMKTSVVTNLPSCIGQTKQTYSDRCRAVVA